MTLSNPVNKVIFDANGATNAWPFSFPVLAADHLKVITTDVDGIETTLDDSQYSVTTNPPWPQGGTVTYPLAGFAAAGTKVTIVRIVPYDQPDRFSNQGAYLPEVVEKRFDMQAMALAQLAETVSRASVGSISDPNTEQSNFLLIQELQTQVAAIMTSMVDMATIVYVDNEFIEFRPVYAYFSSGGTINILKSQGISSIVRNSEGRYTITMTNPMPDLYYSVVAFATLGATETGGGAVFEDVGSVARTTTVFKLDVNDVYADVGSDPEFISLHVFR